MICSYDDGIDGAINNNLKVMFGGFSLIFFYIVITLGRYNCIEQRVSIFFPLTLIFALKCFLFWIFFSPNISPKKSIYFYFSGTPFIDGHGGYSFGFRSIFWILFLYGHIFCRYPSGHSILTFGNRYN